MLWSMASLLLAAASATDVELARKTLAGELGISPRTIRLRSSRDAQWADHLARCRLGMFASGYVLCADGDPGFSHRAAGGRQDLHLPERNWRAAASSHACSDFGRVA